MAPELARAGVGVEVGLSVLVPGLDEGLSHRWIITGANGSDLKSLCISWLVRMAFDDW